MATRSNRSFPGMSRHGRSRTTLALAALVAVAALATYFVGSQGQTAGRASVDAPRWDLLRIGGNEVEQYKSLGTMTKSSDVAMVGTVEAVESGRTFGDAENGFAYYATMKVRVDEVLHGTPILHDGVAKVEVFLGDDNDYSELSATLPGERALFFLRDKGLEAAALGLPESAQAEQSGLYRWVSSQGLLVSSNGRIATPLYPDEHGFPTALRGRPFDDVRAEARQHGSRN